MYHFTGFLLFYQQENCFVHYILFAKRISNTCKYVSLKGLMTIKYYAHTMKRKTQINYYRALVVALIFMFVKIHQIFSSNHSSQSYVRWLKAKM